MSADPINSIFQKTNSSTGMPDLYFARRLKDGRFSEFRAEAKYVATEPKSLRVLWNLLRKNQQVVIPKMAYASQVPIFLFTCIGGKEALVHRFDPVQIAKARVNKIRPWEVLVLAWELRRTIEGKWVMVTPEEPRGRRAS